MGPATVPATEAVATVTAMAASRDTPENRENRTGPVIPARTKPPTLR